MALEHATSADGTPVAFERTGTGPAVILIGGAFNDRGTAGGLAAALAPHATAVCYDRRGRGASGASADYSAEREVQDLTAVIGAVGGSAAVFGHSSGAVLAALAAAQGGGVRKLALYEPSLVTDDSRPRPGDDLAGRVLALLAAGDRDGAAALFLTEAGFPGGSWPASRRRRWCSTAGTPRHGWPPPAAPSPPPSRARSTASSRARTMASSSSPGRCARCSPGSSASWPGRPRPSAPPGPLPVHDRRPAGGRPPATTPGG